MCASIYTLLNGLIQFKCKHNIIGTALFLSCGVISMFLGISFIY